MTSKEKLLNILKNYKLADKGNGDFLSEDYQEELLNPIFKDLEDYEELKKIMGTPIQDIMKRLKILEILKEHIAFKLDERQCDKYLIQMASKDTGNYTYIRLYEEEVMKLLKEWLENDK